MLQDPMLAEEVTQDTFLKLWSRAGQYLTDRGSVRAWLLAIARHAALDCLRHEARHPTLRGDDNPEDFWQDIPDAASLTDETRWRSLHFAVQSLSDEQRRLIDLFYYQGLSQSEISETMGWPIGTVKTRLRSAMQQLRQAWMEE
jgi:RNA polymerase sigma-70 factor (ECF subfamily)